MNKQAFRFKIAIIAGVVIFLLNSSNVCGQANLPTNDNKVPLPATGNVPYKPDAYAAGYNFNLLRTWEPQKPYTQEAQVTAISRTVDEVRRETKYYDPLGRLIQTISWQSSADKKDAVIPVVYDAYGRERYKFLPYISSSTNGIFRIDPFTEQQDFYNSGYLVDQPALSNEKFYYSQTNFDNSPLNRTNKSFSPGNTWVGSEESASEKSDKYEYLVNNTTDNVQAWQISITPLTYIGNDISTNIPATTAAYAAGELIKTVIINADGNQLVEFKDKDGHTVLKKVQNGPVTSNDAYANWLCTCYIYDDFGQLRFVIPPKAIALMIANQSWTLSSAMINELCFRYEYDNKSRLIAKKVPGAGWVYMIYDKRDRLVFTQDGEKRLKNQWIYTTYDALNRPVQSGIMIYAGTSIVLQTYVDNSRSFDHVTSQMITGTFPNGQSFNNEISVSDNPVPPAGVLIPMQITNYDTYDATTRSYSNVNNSKLDKGANGYADPLPSQAASNTQGKVTSVKVRIIEDATNLSVGSWLETVNFYDEKGRVIQTQAINYKGSNDIITQLYDFGNSVLCSYSVHNNPAASVNNFRIKTSLEYDHAGRLLVLKKQLNDDATTQRTISRNVYDALGKLKQKQIGQKSFSDITPLESDAYSYNIRGWLKGINWNYPANGPIASLVNRNNSKWFGMDLSYDWGFSSNQFTGNIGGTRWVSAGDGEQRAFGYGYDAVNRLLYADFNQQFGSSWAKADPSNSNFTINFSVKMGDGFNSSSAYDENGNIKQMQQYGLMLNASPLIDDLHYSYAANGVSNKLMGIHDAGTESGKIGDFKDDNPGTADYGYNLNGSLITDLNKRFIGPTGVDQTGSGAIAYNYLNKPWKISASNSDNSSSNKGTITYIYDATGNKLEKRVDEPAQVMNNNTARQTVTTYIGGIVYENNVLQYLGHEEGRIRPIIPNIYNNNQAFAYDYFLNDHLGNVRMVLTDEQQQGIYQAGMEAANRSFEVSLFGNKVNSTATNKPGGFDSDGNNQQVSAVNGTTAEGRVGPGVILKVMAGDKIKARTYAWYQPAGMDNTTDNSLAGIVTNILGQLTPQVTAIGKGTVAAGATDAIVQPGMENFLSGQTPASGAPKAYLNWVLLDEEQFKMVIGSSGAVRVPQITGTQQKQLLQAGGGNDIEMTRNGYLYVYISNESKGNVYFDDIRIEHTKGSLIEETHYYPFGLVMSGISTKALNEAPKNKIKFQGEELAYNEFSDGSGLEIYEFKYRTHDPQTGRFWQIDPLTSKYVCNSTYAFSENKVTGHVELEGLEALSIQDLWRSAGITSSTDPKEYVTNIGKEFLKPSTWINGYAGAAQIAMPLILTGIMTGGFGEGAVFEAEIKSIRIGSLTTEPLGEQWGLNGLYSYEGKTTTILGTRQGYWGEVIENANKTYLNLVANQANPGGFSYLNVDAVEFDFSTARGRQAFFDTYNKPFIDAAIIRGDKILLLDNPNNVNAIFPNGDISKGYNFYGMEINYLKSLGYTFSNGQVVFPMNQTYWHAPMALPTLNQKE